MTDRHMLSRGVLSKSGAQYVGTLELFGFRYHLVVTRAGDGIEVTAYDGPEGPEPVGEYRMPTDGKP